MIKRRFKYFMPERNEFSVTGEETLLSVSEYYGVKPRAEVFDEDAAGSRAESLEGYRRVHVGDFVMNYMLAWKGAYGVSNYDGIVSPAYAVFKIDPRVADRRFIHHRLRSEHMRSAFRARSKGIIDSRLRLYPDTFLSMELELPDVETQKAISDFLDRETGRIDQLISAKRHLVSLAGEKLSAKLEVFTFDSVTEDSEYRIPFKWVCRIPHGQVDPTEPAWRDKPLIAPNHIESKTGRLLEIESAEEQGAISGKYAFPAGTVLYSKIRPALAKACISPEAGLCSADMYPIIPIARLKSEYLLMQLLSHSFTDWAVLESMRVAMPKINRETIGNIRLVVPPIEKQQSFIDEYDNARQRIELLLDKTNESVERLGEFHSALITAAVTGQIDVSTWGKRSETDRRLSKIEEEMAAASSEQKEARA